MGEYPFKIGDRVRLKDNTPGPEDPEARKGVVIHIEQRGAMVRHDAPGFANGLFAGRRDFNWTFDELQLVARVVA